MPDFLETTVDKFIFKVATDRFYNGEGVWALPEGKLVRIGLSDFLQQRSGDVAFAEVKTAGTQLSFGDEAAVIETIKVNISLSSPVSGKIVEVNPQMELAPEKINLDPYGEGWLALIEASDWKADQAQLLDAPAYFARMKVEAEEEQKEEVMEGKESSEHTQKVVIVPCSGIGKTYGSVSREAAYVVTEDIRAGETELVALSMLVLGDEDARASVAAHPVVTIDGCKLACATKMVQESGGCVAQDFAVLDVYRRYKQFKPQGIAELNEGGQQLAEALANEIAQVVNSLQPSENEGGQNG